jgi:pimeloyl-ACP methyl ester carboxylesterase
VAARDWVTAELLAAWPDRPTLVAELRAAAAAPGPARCELAALTMPSCVLALRDDPLHPLEVARAWAAALPSAQLVELPRQAPAADRSVFGAAVAAWLAGLPGR